MSRHNASRRRTYGRRQHEVKERRRHETWRLESFDDDVMAGGHGPRNPGARGLGFLNSRLSLERNG